MKRVLVVAPHPDDDVIGCGGSIVKHLQNGNDVHVVYCTDTTDIDTATMSREDYRLQRLPEIRVAAVTLGLKPENLTILDHAPWKFDPERLRFDILQVTRQVKPSILYIPHEKDSHIDHQIASIAAQHAVGMAPAPWFREHGDKDTCQAVEVVLGYEVWTALEKPTYFEELSEDQLEKAIRALHEHRTQETYKYDRAMRGRAMYRGAMQEGPLASGLAEGFLLLGVASSALALTNKGAKHAQAESIL